ncbi:phosphatase PAP2 family protein [Mesoplasma photuris]|uniref:phosphatase PAP2 family protein n=1 Tax=Mesoplasma photuris TaxID=217731 RepID=UPI0004E1FBA8|nr:phosphatase PAP2 family protein [Mesoplasma photuris]
MQLKSDQKFSKLIIYPFFILVVVFASLFIISSFFDLEIMQIFQNALKIDFFRYFGFAWHEIGCTEVVIPLLVSGMVINEYVYKNLKSKNKKEWQSQSLLIFVYLVLIAIFIFALVSRWFGVMDTLKDFGSGVQLEFNRMVTKEEANIILIIIYTIQTVIFTTLTILIRFKLSKKKSFVEGTYWKNAINIFTFFIMAYIAVVLLKSMSARPFYTSLKETHDFRLEFIYEKFGVRPEDTPVLTTKEYAEWWEFNGLFINMSNVEFGPKMVTGSAFPSGHVMSSSCTVMSMVYFIKPKMNKSSKIDKNDVFKISMLYLGLTHVILMVLSFLINGSHFLSDTAFSFMWSLACVFISYISVNSVIVRIQSRNNKNLVKVLK